MEYTDQIVANVFEQATYKNGGLRLECVWPCTTSTTNDFTSTSFLSFSHPNFPFLCVAGSYAMSECTGSVLAYDVNVYRKFVYYIDHIVV